MIMYPYLRRTPASSMRLTTPGLYTEHQSRSWLELSLSTSRDRDSNAYPSHSSPPFPHMININLRTANGTHTLCLALRLGWDLDRPGVDKPLPLSSPSTAYQTVPGPDVFLALGLSSSCGCPKPASPSFTRRRLPSTIYRGHFPLWLAAAHHMRSMDQWHAQCLPEKSRQYIPTSSCTDYAITFAGNILLSHFSLSAICSGLRILGS